MTSLLKIIIQKVLLDLHKPYWNKWRFGDATSKMAIEISKVEVYQTASFPCTQRNFDGSSDFVEMVFFKTPK
jgi:hypothetical protein